MSSACVTCEYSMCLLRLKSAQAELKEKEKLCKDSEHTYTKDKADIDTIQKEIAKIEVRCCVRHCM